MLLPHFSADPAFVQRFLREARAAAALSHPNIVTIYDVVEQDGRYFIAMQLAPGVSLKKLLEQTGRLPLGRVQYIMSQIAAALDHAHARGLVHRDVKPDNIIIGPDDHAILTDFGLAKAAERDAALTAIGATVGTPEYMSPEQARGQTVGPASDIYSLGVVLYEMLTGRRPFVASDTSALLYLHVHETPPPIQVRALDLSPKIQTVLNRALAKQPDQRFRSAGELAAALAAVPISRSGRTPAPRPTPRPQLPALISDHEKTQLLRTPTPSPKRRRSVGLWLAALLSGVAVLTLAAFLIQQFLFSSSPQGFASLPAPTASLTTPVQATIPAPLRATTVPVVVASNASTPIPTAAPTATPTALRATATLTATSSRQPTATATIAPTATPTTMSPVVTPPVLLGPPDKETVQGRTTFKWQAVELPPGAAYEVVWWRANANPDTAEGFASPTQETAQEIDIAAYASLKNLPVNQAVRWTVIVVNKEPYERLTLPSANRYQELTYAPSSGGGCLDPSCGK